MGASAASQARTRGQWQWPARLGRRSRSNSVPVTGPGPRSDGPTVTVTCTPRTETESDCDSRTRLNPMIASRTLSRTQLNRSTCPVTVTVTVLNNDVQRPILYSSWLPAAAADRALGHVEFEFTVIIYRSDLETELESLRRRRCSKPRHYHTVTDRPQWPMRHKPPLLHPPNAVMLV